MEHVPRARPVLHKTIRLRARSEQGLIHPLSILSDAPQSFGDYDPEELDRESSARSAHVTRSREAAIFPRLNSHPDCVIRRSMNFSAAPASSYRAQKHFMD